MPATSDEQVKEASKPNSPTQQNRDAFEALSIDDKDVIISEAIAAKKAYQSGAWADLLAIDKTVASGGSEWYMAFWHALSDECKEARAKIKELRKTQA